jgi:predicted nucleotidyltransferase
MSGLNINQQELIQICTKNKIDFLGVFGSAARGEMQTDSDVDILIRFSPEAKVGYFKLYDIEQELVVGLGTVNPLDIVTQDAVNSRIKDRIYSELKTIYGQP